MLLFLDESGTDRSAAPYEVLAGVAIAERDLWNLVQAVRSAERDHFGMTLGEAGVEMKGKSLLKRKVFRHAQGEPIEASDRAALACSFLQEGIAARGRGDSGAIKSEFTAYGQAVLAFVQAVFGAAAQFHVAVFASMVHKNAARPASAAMLRKDYAYLFERFHAFLTDRAPSDMGLVVFDEIDAAQARRLLMQMEEYFLRTKTGRVRSGRIVPELFFVHSDLTTAVQLADLTAYCLNWGTRLNRMVEPTRSEIEPYAQMVFDLRFVGRTIDQRTNGDRPLYGVTYLDDLRPALERGGNAP